MRTRRLLLFCLFLVPAPAALSQPVADEASFRAREKMDSLTRKTEQRIFSAWEQKTWRQCVRGKREFLEQSRKADPAFAALDTLIRHAKLGRVSPEDPEVRKLMERKFLQEKSLEDRYQAGAEGIRCLETEENRRRKLDSALAAIPEYRKWKRLAEPVEGASDAI